MARTPSIFARLYSVWCVIMLVCQVPQHHKKPGKHKRTHSRDVSTCWRGLFVVDWLAPDENGLTTSTTH
ncbi:hypothetical protein M378DRAFT_425067 [Amanita muscaria Koide BX008]|uniref:Secreted protein n=1 Tax=Amanita muscaria (strain Koide BX008) TaxID=946122 RepID=A0A0C2WW55_AMAMK|nr:hypothetical protein M378DRAFT_425067 [Amanita muscaria Koide BX008]